VIEESELIMTEGASLTAMRNGHYPSQAEV
jgi:hypothetical protein